MSTTREGGKRQRKSSQREKHGLQLVGTLPSKNGAKLLTALKFAIASSLVYVLVIAENYHIAALEKNEIFLRAAALYSYCTS